MRLAASFKRPRHLAESTGVMNNTEIQMTGVARDLGVHVDPDTFYRTAGTNLSGLKALLYRHLIRRAMNHTVATIRSSSGDADRHAHQAPPPLDSRPDPRMTHSA